MRAVYHARCALRAAKPATGLATRQSGDYLIGTASRMPLPRSVWEAPSSFLGCG